MKKVIFFSFLLLSIYCFGENDVEMSKDSFPTYQGIVKMEGKTNKQIYSILKEWTAVNFKSSKDVIQLDTPENDKLIIKGNSDYFYNYKVKVMFKTREIPISGKFYYMITFDIKENRFRFTIDIIDVTTDSGSSFLSLMINKTGSYNYDQPYQEVHRIKNDLINRLSNIKEQKQDTW